MANLQKVFCDIETTSLQPDSHIIQLSATCGTDSFDRYITTTQSVAPGATAVHGLTTGGGKVYHHGRHVSAKRLKDAMRQFLDWLAQRAPVILIGHDFREFGFPHMIIAVNRVEMNVLFKKRIDGAVDTLSLFREVYPERKSYKLVDLVRDVLPGESYEAHNALADATILQKLYNKSKVSDAVFLKHFFKTSVGFKEELTKVFCDIETTSLQSDSHIIQLSAICGNDSFDQYITTTQSVAPGATAVHGLTSGGGKLYHHGKSVSAKRLKDAMRQFLDWLAQRAPVILIGHNLRKFGFPHMIIAVDRVKMNDEFKKRIDGAVDTLSLFREVYPERKSYKLVDLVRDVLPGESYEAHNALADATILQKLYNKSKVSDAVFLKHFFKTSVGFKEAGITL